MYGKAKGVGIRSGWRGSKEDRLVEDNMAGYKNSGSNGIIVFVPFM